HDRGTKLGERGEEVVVDVVHGDLETGASERLGDTPAGTHGHVALVGQSAREDEDVRGAHARSGPGESTTRASAPGTVPKISTSSRSPATTPASRRTPSRMRSGGGKQKDRRM